MGRPSSLRALAVGAVVLLVAGCGGGGGPPAPAPVERVEVTPGGFMLPGGQGSARLTARVLASDGSVLERPVTWRSSAPGVVAVSAEGVATAAASLGSAQVTAEAGGVRSPPVLALVAWPAAGAVLVADEQVVGAPSPLDPPESYGPGWRYQVTLRGVAPLGPGTIVVAAGAKPVGGRVVSSAPSGGDQVATLELVALSRLFDRLEIDEELDLSEVTPIAAEGVQGSVARLAGGGWVARSEAPLLARPLGRAFRVGPFTCELAVEIPGIEIEIPDHGATQSLRFVLRYHLASGEPERLAEVGLRGGMEAWGQLTVRLAAAAEPKITCEALPWHVPVAFLGPLSLVFAGDVAFGPAVELSAKVTGASAGLEAEARVAAELGASLTCPADGGDCGPAGSASADGTLTLTPDWGGPASELRFELSGAGYALAKPGFRSLLLLGWGFDVMEVKAGLRATRDHAPMSVQAADAAYHSGLATSLFAELGAAGSWKKLAEWLPVKFVEAKLTSEVPLARFPSGAFAVAPSQVPVGGSATFTVTLDARTYLGVDAVAAVRVFRRAPVAGGGSTLVEVCSAVPVASAQTEFTCQATFPAALQGTHALFAFVETTDPAVPWPLEVSDDARVVLTVGSPPVVIVDPNLELQVRLWIQYPTPGPVITEADMLRLVELPYCHEKGIASLEGLQHAANLRFAAFNVNQITDLTPLAGLTRLTYLTLTRNQITSVEPLRGLVDLETLYVDDNQIADVGPLAGIVKLTSFDVSNNLVTDLGPLAGMVNLDWIDFGVNRVTSLEALAGMTRLFSVGAGYNQIADLTPLAGLPNLKYLPLDYNLITDLAPLVANPGLSAGDSITLVGNCLDLTPGTPAAEQVAALLARGVTVRVDQQTCGGP